MNKPVKYSPEVRDRAVRMVLEHQDSHGSQWAAIESIVGKIGVEPGAISSHTQQITPFRRVAR